VELHNNTQRSPDQLGVDRVDDPGMCADHHLLQARTLGL
jgi:hypothetical protein